MNQLTIDEISLKGKRALVRVDFNVPLDENLNITNDIRINARKIISQYHSHSFSIKKWNELI